MTGRGHCLPLPQHCWRARPPAAYPHHPGSGLCQQQVCFLCANKSPSVFVHLTHLGSEERAAH